MKHLSLTVSFTLNVNDLNIPIERQRLEIVRLGLKEQCIMYMYLMTCIWGFQEMRFKYKTQIV